MEITEQVGKIIAYGDLCDHCLGRFFGKRSFGLSNDERGHALRVAHALSENVPFSGEKGCCWICHDLFDMVEIWAGRVVDALAGIEYSTFLVGSRIPALMAESEEMVWSDLGLSDAEPLKSEVNRTVGKTVSLITGKSVDFIRPDVVVLLDLATGSVGVKVSPVFIYGRYRKFERGIPQTHWACRNCQGRGCPQCEQTGKQYQDSVEELIARPLIEIFLADTAILHGAGREDIDARMIGTGRPFIMEVVSPRKRRTDLPALENTINRSADGRVSVSLQRWCARDDVETIKSNKAHKKYRILVEVEGNIPDKAFQLALSSLNGVLIHQRTPLRVSHRRADKVRERRVLEISYIGRSDAGYILEVTGESGLYIKELVSGDNGRTEPSLSGVLCTPARVSSLDVIEVGGPIQGE
ncbi:MAG: tRNA pseudouridine(54/55) synthase Pus10 [Methanoregulaceae archaeon]|nr:tRNA pseudouridine(54/55) synthase Pus10 [Methanoregulaceae archaeon]